MTSVGFVGLWFCKQLREHDGLTERQFMQPNGGAAVWLFSGYFVIGLLVLFPHLCPVAETRGSSHPGAKSASLDRVVSHYHRARPGERHLVDCARAYTDHVVSPMTHLNYAHADIPN